MWLSDKKNHGQSKKTRFAPASRVFFVLLAAASGALNFAACETEQSGNAASANNRPPVVIQKSMATENRNDQPLEAQTNKSIETQTNKNAQPKPSAAAAAVQSSGASIVTLIQKWFGAQVEAAEGRKPTYFVADFNGDQKEDVAIVLRLKVKPSELNGEAKVLNPWLAATEPAAEASDTNKEFALGIVHGADKDWQTGEPAAKFILLDAVYSDMKLLKKADEQNDYLPAAAIGDGILTGTESASGIIYWDGKTYRWEQFGD